MPADSTLRGISKKNFYGKQELLPRALRPGRGSEAAICAARRDDTRLYKEFPTQDQAFRYVDSHPHLQLHAWALEIDGRGRRRFVAASYASFWRRYRRYIRHGWLLHRYEIIRTGYACKLYFDLEYARVHNADVDGDALVKGLVSAVLALGDARGVRDAGRCVVLDSSTGQKWSKHIIFPNLCFYDAAQAGEFAKEAWEQAGGHLVNDGKGGMTPFVDFAVYTRNRCFRLVASSKFGKTARLLADGHDVDARISVGETLFMDALVCNVEPAARILGVPRPAWAARSGFERRGVTMEAREGAGEEYAGPCRIDDYIMSVVGPHGGSIHSVTQMRGAVAYAIKGGYKWCGRVGRHHKSNNVILIVDMRTREMFQKCFDPDCRDYCSEPVSVPAAVFGEMKEGEQDEVSDAQLCAMMDELDGNILGDSAGEDIEISDEMLNDVMDRYEREQLEK